MVNQNNPIPSGSPITEPVLIALISEELKSRRFFGTLQELGLNDSHFEPHLDQLIMQGLNLKDDNATLDRYFRVMDEHARKIGIQEESVRAEAREVLKKLKQAK